MGHILYRLIRDSTLGGDQQGTLEFRVVISHSYYYYCFMYIYTFIYEFIFGKYYSL